jgi:hypothetical protein
MAALHGLLPGWALANLAGGRGGVRLAETGRGPQHQARLCLPVEAIAQDNSGLANRYAVMATATPVCPSAGSTSTTCPRQWRRTGWSGFRCSKTGVHVIGSPGDNTCGVMKKTSRTLTSRVRPVPWSHSTRSSTHTRGARRLSGSILGMARRPARCERAITGERCTWMVHRRVLRTYSRISSDLIHPRGRRDSGLGREPDCTRGI